MAFEQADGSAFAELPEMLRQPSAVPGTPSSKEMLEQGARALVDLFRGVPYSERFAKWTKKFESKVVNGREERMLVCEPVAAGHFQRAELALDNRDLPWRVVWFLARPEGGMDRLIDEPVWTEIDGKLLMTSFKKTWGPKSEQVVVKYLRKRRVPGSVELREAEPGKPPVESSSRHQSERGVSRTLRAILNGRGPAPSSRARSAEPEPMVTGAADDEDSRHGMKGLASVCSPRRHGNAVRRLPSVN